MKNKYFLSLLASVLCAVAFSSCATLGGNINREVTISSVPSNAYVEVVDARGKLVGQGRTPATFHLKTQDGYFKRAKYSVRFAKDGYDDAVAKLQPTFNGNYIWNFFSFSIIGMAVDHATGSVWRFDGDTYTYDLRSYGPETLNGRGNAIHNNNTVNNNNTNTNTQNVIINIDSSILKQKEELKK